MYLRQKKVRSSKENLELNDTASSKIDKELKQIFDQCCKDATQLTNVTNGDRLVLYGLYKQATAGDAPEEKPSMLQVVARAKHNSWSNFHGMPQHEAMAYYIKAVKEFGDGNSIPNEEEDLQLPSSGLGLKPSQLIDNAEDETNDDGSLEAKLLKAASSKNLTLMKELIEQGVDFNHADDNGETALHLCADRGMVDGVAYLLQLGADPNVADNDGISVLQAAVIAGHFLVCKILLEKGADPDQKDDDGDSPRSCAEDDDNARIKELFSKLKKK